MRLVFFGASQLGYKCCKFIMENKLAEVVGIFTIPEKFKISYSKKPVTNVLYADFHSLGREFRVPVIEIQDKMKRYETRLRNFQPDFLCVIGWYYMIPLSIREIAPKGCAGIHASLLPKYRGGAPLVWAIINGEARTGVSFFYFEDGIDNGDIIAQESFAIGQNETVKNLVKKAERASIKILKKYLPLIASDSAPRIPQKEAEATYFPQRNPDDGLIDWSWDCRTIKNFIRAQTRPYPGAYTIINGKKVTIFDAELEEVGK